MKYVIYLLLASSIAIPGLYIRHVLGIPPTEYQTFWIAIIMLPILIVAEFLPGHELFKESVLSVGLGFTIIICNDLLWKKYRMGKTLAESYDE
ncbi:hypothetical protein [Natrinema salaciae]|uniref:Uncharacterized protein n=1 Tax=Natrinema salaciae TaxID=1186196 RepID=A0A1H9S327_9EURY|nr:hypothetical protein [Natrinema salaciae]SER79401.1 hypothetical protein SAMN04489841_4562 [Natrinema salaciae]